MNTIEFAEFFLLFSWKVMQSNFPRSIFLRSCHTFLTANEEEKGLGSSALCSLINHRLIWEENFFRLLFLRFSITTKWANTWNSIGELSLSRLSTTFFQFLWASSNNFRFRLIDSTCERKDWRNSFSFSHKNATRLIASVGWWKSDENVRHLWQRGRKNGNRKLGKKICRFDLLKKCLASDGVFHEFLTPLYALGWIPCVVWNFTLPITAYRFDSHEIKREKRSEKRFGHTVNELRREETKKVFMISTAGLGLAGSCSISNAN